jgi:hypothetical protein
MSEYQFYDFQALDRPLTSEERAAISQLSSRTKPTATQSSFLYHYGDFPGDPKKFLADYFDIMYYIANWGTQQLMFRFPQTMISREAIEPYLVENCIELSQVGKWAILNWEFHQEEGFDCWIEGEGTLSELVGLRAEILQQDYRGLYLAWLKAITLSEEYVEIDPDRLEPPIPPGLQNLSPAQKAFTETFEVNEYLLAIACASSGTITPISEKSLKKALDRLSPAESRQFLLRLLEGEPNLSIQLRQRLSEMIATPSTIHPTRHTIQQLFDLAREQEVETMKLQKEEAERQRIHSLEVLAKKEGKVWEEIDTLIQKKQGISYDSAVSLLVQLRDLAEYQNRLSGFRQKLERLREEYSNRPGFLERLRTAKL